MAKGNFQKRLANFRKEGELTAFNLALVAPIAAGPLAFVVNPSVPANTMKEFLALAKQKPGQLIFAGTGIGAS